MWRCMNANDKIAYRENRRGEACLALATLAHRMAWLRHAFIALAAVAVATSLARVSALAQDYPTKPIKLIVVTAAGGLMDVAARITAEHLGKVLGQPLVIENRPGSGGNLGAEAIAKAEPDGHTIGLIQVGNVAVKRECTKTLDGGIALTMRVSHFRKSGQSGFVIAP